MNAAISRIIALLLVVTMLLSGGAVMSASQENSQPEPVTSAVGDSGSILYVYNSNNTTAEDWRVLLEAMDWAVYTMTVDELVYDQLVTYGNSIPVPKYDVIIISTDAYAAGGLWSEATVANNSARIKMSGIPVIGLGTGGLDFFTSLGLKNLTTSNAVSVSAITDITADKQYVIYNDPISILTAPSNAVAYNTAMPAVGVTRPGGEFLRTATSFGTAPGFSNISTVAQEDRYFFWGMQQSAADFTLQGAFLFDNVLQYVTEYCVAVPYEKMDTHINGVVEEFFGIEWLFDSRIINLDDGFNNFTMVKEDYDNIYLLMMMEDSPSGDYVLSWFETDNARSDTAGVGCMYVIYSETTADVRVRHANAAGTWAPLTVADGVNVEASIGSGTGTLFAEVRIAKSYLGLDQGEPWMMGFGVEVRSYDTYVDYPPSFGWQQANTAGTLISEQNWKGQYEYIPTPYNAPPVLDGVIGSSEWNSCSYSYLTNADRNYTYFRTMHDGENLYLGIVLENSTETSDGIWLYFDPDGSASSQPQPDDFEIWGTKGSGVLFEHNGTGTGWDATTDYPSESYAYVQDNADVNIELSIPFERLGITPGTVHNIKMGATFRLNDSLINVPDGRSHTDTSTWNLTIYSPDFWNAPPKTNLSLSGPYHVDEYGYIYVTNGTMLNLGATDDDVFGVDGTWYSVDGGSTYQNYTGDIPVNWTSTGIWYGSLDTFGANETVHKQTLYFDDSPPNTTIAVGDPNATGMPTIITSSTPINLTSEDICSSGVESIWYSVDPGNWTMYTGNFTIPQGGAHTIWYNAVDNVGNMEPPKQYNVSVDTAPQTTVTPGAPSYQAGPGMPVYFTTATLFNLSATDDTGVSEIRYSTDNGSSIGTYTSEIGLALDTTSFMYWSVDSGPFAQEETPNVLELIGDETAPVTSLSMIGPGNGTSPVNVSQNTLFSLTAADNVNGSGIAGIMYRIDNGTWTAYTDQFNFSALGLHTLDFNATDNLANSEVTQTLEVFVEESTGPINGWLAGSVIDMSLVPISGAVVSLFSNSSFVSSIITGAAGQFNFTLLPGSYDVTVAAAGYTNASASGLTVNAGVETDAGQILLFNSSATIGWLTGTVEDDAGASLDGAAIAITLNGSVITSGTTDANGTFNLTVPALDGYNVTASMAGYESAGVTGQNVTDGNVTNVGVITLVDIPDLYASIEGKVVDIDAEPVAGAQVTLLINGGPVETVYTDSNGTFSIDNVTVIASTPYEIVISADGFEDATISGITLIAGSVTTLDQVLEAPPEDDGVKDDSQTAGMGALLAAGILSAIIITILILALLIKGKGRGPGKESKPPEPSDENKGDTKESKDEPAEKKDDPPAPPEPDAKDTADTPPPPVEATPNQPAPADAKPDAKPADPPAPADVKPAE